MKNLILAITALLVTQNASAYLDASAVTEFSLEIYGIYTSSDPSCQNALKATVPLSASPRYVNFADNPSLGVGKVPKSIRCVVIVAKNIVRTVVAPGNYTSSTLGNSDNVCNAGRTMQSSIHKPGMNIAWPAKIVADLAALGLPAITSIAAPTGNEILPVYLSTDAKCRGDLFSDQNTPDCWVGNESTTNHMVPPSMANDTLGGVKLSQPDEKSSYQFYADISKFVGADDWDGNPLTEQGCGSGIPLWGFK